MGDALALATILYEKHKKATTSAGIITDQCPILSSLSIEKRIEIANMCSEIINGWLAEYVPEYQNDGCDLSITVINLLQALSLAIQRDSKAVTTYFEKSNISGSKRVLIFTEIGQYVEGVTLNECTAYIGPVMFKSYRERVPEDYMVKFYKDATKSALLQRVQLVAVVLNNLGPMNSDVVRACVAVTTDLDYSDMEMVKMHTQQITPKLYNIFNSAVDSDKRWRAHQKKLMGKPTECIVCGSPTTQKCTTCKLVYYCKRACQAHDWSTHKQSCKK